MRRLGVIMAATVLVGAFGGNAAVAQDAAPSHVQANIVGRQTVIANQQYTATYHFPNEPLRVAQGGTITFVNQTDDFHTITLVTKSDLPVPFSGGPVDAGTVQNNCSLCGAVNSLYGGGSGPPNGLQIDNGQVNDDDAQADADAPDAAAIATAGGLPPGLSLLTEDFDTPGTGGASPTVGDSTIIGPVGSGAPTQRTVQMTGAPGTYWYFCTFHPWMEGSIIVEPASHGD